MTTTRFAAITALILLSCAAPEKKVAQSEPAITDTIAPAASAATVPPYESESVQPNVRPLLPEEYAAMNVPRPAPARSRSVARASVELPPILDERKRECIGYPISESLTRTHMNLLLQPNLYDITIRNWSNPQWRATFRVEDGTFPVNLWRKRPGQPDTFIKQVRVQAGPGLPHGNPQEVLSMMQFRGGDVLCVEATRVIGPLFVAYDERTGLVVQPQLSVVQNTGGDATPMPGKWTTVSGETR